ncbi:unnamed protein product, partial [marine sediment metagenome]
GRKVCGILAEMEAEMDRVNFINLGIGINANTSTSQYEKMATSLKEELKRVEGVKAFFVNDPTRAWYEIRELAQIDRNMDGTIDSNELMELRGKTIRLGTTDKMMELFTSHPNSLKRIKHLSSLVA